MELSSTDLILISLGIAEFVVLPVIAWLVHSTSRHSRDIAAIRSEVTTQRGTDAEVKQLLRDTNGRITELRGDVHQLLERTEWLMRTTDRHERFLEAMGGGEK